MGVPLIELNSLGMDGRMLAALLETSEDAIICKSLKGIILTWNAGAQRIFGYKVEEIVGRPATALMSVACLQEEEMILAKLGRGERIQHYETDRITKTGQHVRISLSVTPIRDASGRIIAAAKVARDITERQHTDAKIARLNFELEHLSRLHVASHLATGLTHELNQPLSAILNYAVGLQSMFKLGQMGEAQWVASLNDLAEQARRASEIIRSLRSFVQKRKRSFKPLDLNRSLVETLGLLDSLLRADGITVRLNLAEGLETVAADEVRLSQVFVNLIRNARDAMMVPGAVGKQLTIISRHVGGALEVDVVDQGCGLPPERVDRLIEPFSSAKPDGLGMGLAISMSILEDCNGTLTAAANPDGGTIFKVRLPAERSEKQGVCNGCGTNGIHRG